MCENLEKYDLNKILFRGEDSEEQLIAALHRISVLYGRKGLLVFLQDLKIIAKRATSEAEKISEIIETDTMTGVKSITTMFMGIDRNIGVHEAKVRSL